MMRRCSRRGAAVASARRRTPTARRGIPRPRLCTLACKAAAGLMSVGRMREAADAYREALEFAPGPLVRAANHLAVLSMHVLLFSLAWAGGPVAAREKGLGMLAVAAPIVAVFHLMCDAKGPPLLPPL